VTLDAPAVSGNNTLVLPTGNGTANQILRNGATAGSLEFTDKIVSGTAVASTSGTSIDFTGIPSWVKRVTVMFNGVSLSGTSNLLVQLGTGSTTYTTSGYSANSGVVEAAGITVVSSTAGFIDYAGANSSIVSGHMIITNISGNNWISSHTTKLDTAKPNFGAGNVALSAVLTAVRITTVNGTDTFDAGSINILYE
jgi:hypothetical protein